MQTRRSFVPISDIMSSKTSRCRYRVCALIALSLNVSPEVVGDLLVVTRWCVARDPDDIVTELTRKNVTN